MSNDNKSADNNQSASDEEPRKKIESTQNELPIGISLGLCIGVALGIVFNNIGVGTAIGVCLGAFIGHLIKTKN